MPKSLCWDCRGTTASRKTPNEVRPARMFAMADTMEAAQQKVRLWSNRYQKGPSIFTFKICRLTEYRTTGIVGVLP